MADNTLMEKMINEMSDEEIAAMLGKLTRGEKEPEPEKEAPAAAPQGFTVRLPDGTEVQTGSREEAEALLASSRRAEEPEPSHAAPAARPEFNAKKYHELLVNDPVKAAEYLELSRTGFPVSQALPLMLATIGQLTAKVTELETRGFVAGRSELSDPGNKAVVEKIVRERGWQPSHQSMQDAFDIASARGLIKTAKADEETPAAQPAARPFVPPRVPRGGGKEVTESAILQQAGQLNDDQLEALMIQSGLIRQRHLT